MLVLQGAMAALVFAYYFWPKASRLLFVYTTWQQSGGILAAALAAALAGGVLSEFSLVYFQDKGRWSSQHREDLLFKFALFFINGAVVYEFYRFQTAWFGEGTSWSILVPKILVDQFIFTVLWSTPYQTLMYRWKAERYSGRRLWDELNWDFVASKMLPIIVTNWMFWLPGVTLIYSMPSPLQSPLFSFGIAIWGLILPAVSRQTPATSPLPTPVSAIPAITPQTIE
jgi:hypothetical protein